MRALTLIGMAILLSAQQSVASTGEPASNTAPPPALQISPPSPPGSPASQMQMPSPTVAAVPPLVALVVAFLGGGTVATIISLIAQNRTSRRQREADFLESQLRELYGPLQFFAAQNRSLFALCNSIHDAYTAEYVEQQYAPAAHESVMQDARATLDLSNQYVRRVVANNEKVMDVLRNGWHFIDPDDCETFSKFQIDFVRLETEVLAAGALATPFMIYQRLGSISYMRPQLIQRVAQKFAEKTARLRALRNLSRDAQQTNGADAPPG